MKTCTRAACAALFLLPGLSHGQDTGQPDEAADEIVVVGRSVVTTSNRIEVERELLVDSATVLKDIPGANVNSNGLITGIAQYRGLYGDRIAVELDGMGMISGGPNAMDTPLSYMSPMITEELVVERGIASVSSAPESIGGYINTKLARGDFGDNGFGTSGTIGTRYSANGDVNTSAGRLTLADARHRFSIVAEIDGGGDISTPAGEIRPSGLGRERYDVSYGFDSGDRRLLLFAGRLDTSNAGTPALPMDIRFIETDMAGLQFGLGLVETVDIEGRLAWNDVDHLMDNFTLRGAPAPMQFRQNLTHGSGSQFSLAAHIGLEASRLTLGLDGIMAEHDAAISNPNMAMFRVDNFADIQRDVRGTFVEWQKSFKVSTLVLGLRYKRVETAAGVVGAVGMPEPMATNVGMLADRFNDADRSLVWNSFDAVLKYRRKLSERTEWIVEVGSKSRAPSYQELYLWLPLQASGGLADGRTYVGNLGLDYERSNEIVIGLSAETGRLRLSPQIYFRRIDDYIQGIPSTDMLVNMVSRMMSGAPALSFSNIDAEIWGADIAWKFELGDRWFVDGIASFSQGRRADASDNLYRLAPPNGSIGLTYMADDWSIKPEVVLYSKQDDVSMFNNEQPTPAYELLNVAFSWNAGEAWRIEARIDNLLDDTYQDHLAGINRAMGSDIPVGTRLYGAERTLSAGVVLTF